MRDQDVLGSRLEDAVARMVGRLGAALKGVPGAGALGGEVQRFLRTAASGDGATGDGETCSVDIEEPLDRLVAAASLTPFDVDLIVLAGLADHHEGLAAVLRAAHPRGEPWASAGLAARLLTGDGNGAPVDRLVLRHALEAGAAVTTGLLRLDGPGPLWERSLRLPEGLWSCLLGLDVTPGALDVVDGVPVLTGLDGWLASVPVGHATAALRSGRPWLITVQASAGDVACERARALVHAAGAPMILARPGPSDLDPEVDAMIGAHALVRGATPVVGMPDADPGAPAPPARSVLPHHPGPVVVACAHGVTVSPGARPMLVVDAPPLGPVERRVMWRSTLPELAEAAGELAARHPVEPSVAAAAAEDARRLAALDHRSPTLPDVAAGVRARASQLLPVGVRLVRPVASWDGLVLAGDRLEQLREAADRLAHQDRVFADWGFLAGRPGARGVRMLFAGPPGTGKTLSAEVLASALDVELLLVDLSRVVSKWIGETEKHLADVFDAAERTHAVLLFDEADALFGERTEVRDAHDRYANLETAFLLSRLERFEGLAVLATNLRHHIDAAFTRRLDYVVEFAEPDEGERVELWRCHLPAGAPLGSTIDVHQLASLYPVVGGVIRNAAVAAAFAASSEGAPIEQRHLVRCVRREYEKAGRPFPGAPAELR